MDFGGESRFNANLGNGPATNAYQQSSPLAEQGHGSSNNNHLEAHPPALGNNRVPPSSSSSSSSSSPNPFLVPNNAASNTVKGSSSIDPVDDTLGHHSPIAPSANESSGGNLFHEQPNTHNKATVPTNDESHNPFQVNEQGHQDMASNNMGTSFPAASESLHQEHIHAPPKLELDTHIAAEPSDGDIPISSMSEHEHSHDVAGQHLAPVSNLEHSTNKGQEIQTPQVQVMERPNESATSSKYVFPSHVFARNNTNAPEWSTASNESLFSIYMGNMSFSSELACFKSCELDKPGDVCIPDHHNTSPSHQPPAPVNKFNAISQRTAELHEEGLKVTEAKAAETMREVIMESSRTTENVGKREDSHRDSNSRRQSDGSTKSYAFQSLTDTDKNVSSKGAGERQKSQKQSEEKETPKAVDQAPKSNAPPNGWFSCFSCCTFCY